MQSSVLLMVFTGKICTILSCVPMAIPMFNPVLQDHPTFPMNYTTTMSTTPMLSVDKTTPQQTATPTMVILMVLDTHTTHITHTQRLQSTNIRHMPNLNNRINIKLVSHFCRHAHPTTLVSFGFFVLRVHTEGHGFKPQHGRQKIL